MGATRLQQVCMFPLTYSTPNLIYTYVPVFSYNSFSFGQLPDLQ